MERRVLLKVKALIIAIVAKAHPKSVDEVQVLLNLVKMTLSERN